MSPSEEDERQSLLEDNTRKTLQRIARWTCVTRVLLVCGVIGIAVFSTLIVVTPGLIRDYISDYVSITTPRSPLYRAWVNPEDVGVKTYRYYYFYNLTNPLETLNGIAPNLVEIGPFVYRETTQKYNVRWFVNGTLGYNYQRLMHFEPSLSIDEQTGRALDEATEFITVPNPALKGILYRVGKLPSDDIDLNLLACEIIRLSVNATIGDAGIFTRRVPQELLWGYVDEIWSELHPLVKLLGYKASTIFRSQWNGSTVVPSPYTYRSGQMCPLWTNVSVCNGTDNLLTLEVSGRRHGVVTPQSQLSGPVPGTIIPVDEGGIWPPTWQAPYPTVAGYPTVVDSASHGTITQFAGQQSLFWWGPAIDGITGGVELNPGSATNPANTTPEAPPPGLSGPEECRVANGSDGLRFAPFLDPSQEPWLFIDMIGRPIGLRSSGPVDYDGITVTRFNLNSASLSDSERNRYCFSQRFSGFINLSRPAFGPGVASKAFYMDTCLFDDQALVAGDVNRARQCVDANWKGPNSLSGDRDAGFTGKRLTLNITFSIASPNNTGALGAKRLSFDDYIKARTGGEPFVEAARQPYESIVDIHTMTGITLKGIADVLVSMFMGPFTADGCSSTSTHEKLTDAVLNSTGSIRNTVLPFLRMRRQAEAAQHWINKLRRDLELLHVMHILLWTGLAFFIALLVLPIPLKFCLIRRLILTVSEKTHQQPEETLQSQEEVHT